MKVAIVGTEHASLVTGACFSEIGINVTCVDVDRQKISNLEKGIIPVYEPDLENIVERNYKVGRSLFMVSCIDDVIFSAVETSLDEDDRADLRYVLEIAHTIGQHINKYVLVITKSTVSVGTAQKIKHVILEELNKRNVDIPFDAASKSGFLKEGAAVKYFMNPNCIIIGVESEQSKILMDKLYKSFTLLTLNNYRTTLTDIPFNIYYNDKNSVKHENLNIIDQQFSLWKLGALLGNRDQLLRNRV